jgi:hypothetical protein
MVSVPGTAQAAVAGPSVTAVAGPSVTAVAGRSVTAVAGPSAKWMGPYTIPSAMSYEGAPALAVYDGLLYAAWQGQSSPYHIWYSTYNGATWSPQVEVPHALTNTYTGPTLAVYDGDLYLAWQGQSSPYHIWYASFNGTSWSNQAEVPDALVNASSAVGMAAYDGDLYLAWTGQSSPYQLWYSAFNGTSWAPQAKIPSATSSGAFYYADTPLVSYGGILYVSWATGPDAELEYAAFAEGSWGAALPVDGGGVTSTAGPALTVLGSKMYESWSTVIGGFPVGWESFNGASWSKVKEIPKSETNIGPGLAAYDGSLYDAWLPDILGSPIDYSIRT